jgi:hypothetical protein
MEILWRQETMSNNEQGIDIGELEIIDDEPEPQPKKEQQKTATEQFTEELMKFSDYEQAKAAIADIATKIGCAKSLGYKVIKRLKRQGQFGKAHMPRMEAKEPTAKIAEIEPEPIETTTPTAENEPEIDFTDNETLTETQPTQQPETLLKEKDVEWLIQRGSEGLAKLTEYSDFTFETKDSHRLAEMWTPIVNKYMPQWAPHIPEVIAAVTTAVIIVPKVQGYRKFRAERKQKQIIEHHEPAPTPKPEPKETPKEPEPEKPPEKPKTSNILKALSS